MKVIKSRLLIVTPLVLLFLFAIITFYDTVGASLKEEEKSEQEILNEMHNGATVGTPITKENWKSSLNMVNSNSNLKSNSELKKWVVRVLIEKQFMGEKVEMNEAVKEAKERLQYEKSWLELALNEYNITFTDQEVDEWIANGPDKHPVKEMYDQAEALGLTLEELNHEYDRDFYIKWVVWDKLRPVLADKYNVDMNAEFEIGEPVPNTILVEYYDLEVKEYKSK